MEITITKNQNTKLWTALLKMDGYADHQSSDRVGCAVRDVLNRFEYTMGKPSGDLVITIEGW